MNKELQQKLYNDFPDLYRQKDWSMKETCMVWGFDVGDGWYDIIYDLSKKITELDPEVQAIQVKEKFGGLRFYIGGVNKDVADDVYDAINIAEDLSYKTCEECGTMENVSQNKSGWILTLCESCRIKRDEERKFRREQT